MQKRKSIANIPLLLGAMLSIAIHSAALYYRGIYTLPEPIMESGHTVVHLTLMPSIASQARTAESEPQPIEKEQEPVIEPKPIVASNPAPVPTPLAQPEIEPAPHPPTKITEETVVDSIEQDASLIEDKGVTFQAHTTAPVSPVYPRLSRRRGEEGVVALSVQVLSNGKVGSIELIESSGYKRLDNAACNAAQNATFVPAKRFGKSIESITELSFNFRLTNE